jgi:hypothetical protein
MRHVSNASKVDITTKNVKDYIRKLWGGRKQFGHHVIGAEERARNSKASVRG